MAGIYVAGAGGDSPRIRMVAYGDSTTTDDASTPDDRWPNIVATNRSWYLISNSGVSATPLQNTVQTTVPVIGGPAAGNGRDTYVARVVDYDPDYVLILYGLNDVRLNDVAFTSALYQNDLGELVDLLVAAGITANKIVIGSPPYMDPAFYGSYAPWDGGSTPDHVAHVAAAAAVAAAKGTLYVDIYQAMIDGGGNALISVDGVHPNDAGHAVIANAFLAVL